MVFDGSTRKLDIFIPNHIQNVLLIERHLFTIN